MNGLRMQLADDLSAFVALKRREYFEDDFANLLDNLDRASEQIADVALSEALGQLADRLRHWLREVEEIREQWLYDNCALELPADYLRVFGHTSRLAMRLGPILNRCKRIVQHLQQTELPSSPREVVTVGELARRYHRSEDTIRRWAKKGLLPRPHRPHGKQRGTVFYRDEVPQTPPG